MMEKFETVHTLGKGACGSVFLVRHVDSRKLFALKMIELDEKRKTRTKEAVTKEASILSKLKHPHIVAFQESFLDEATECLVIIQDYCDGGTLADKIIDALNKKSCFEEKQIMHWFIQIVMAVQYIHSKKVLHRDLKTENVFLTKANVVKIGDFGISKTLNNTIDVAKTVVGTPSYLSPELCQDIPYNSKSDIWAVGCVLYELCALHPPFDAQNLLSLFFKIIKAEFEPIPSHYSKPVHELITSMLMKTPEDRPSASAILSLAYVKEHLTHFIEENESRYLRQQKVLRDNSQSSPSVQNSSVSRLKNNLSSPNTAQNLCKTPSPRVRRKPDVSQCPDDIGGVAQKDSGLGVTEGDGSQISPLEETDKASDYSDDFDDSSDSEIEEDITEEQVKEASDEEVEYADDFEEYDPNEDLEEIVHQAREAQELKAVDDFFEDVNEDSEVTVVQAQTSFLKKQCIQALGTETFEEVKKKAKAGAIFSVEELQPHIRRTIADDAAEICYLSSEDLL